ncbi:iron-containing alcohol dehydrogenase [Glaciecola sp. XM2]|uniref:iron-containing alcohol dehydrogenase n=1 Tax=Glaciecola sp. XM2 TaxID=1914931 RepID=UPI001BDEB33D|nr:iron-containing alcohol dehydrogenase [Glaciecola sp. XM2]MBT1450915.1 iron-containing alcohol dehydrogenase [Glaciecola sp. XM2]
MSTQILLPPILQIGADASRKIVEVLQSFHCQHPMIVTDSMMVKLGYVKVLVDDLKQSGIRATIYEDTVPEPTIASLLDGVSLAKNENVDCLIAIGGGSPIDSAKAIGILAKYGGKMQDYRFPRIVNEPSMPIIAIPTTAGTGSEMTKFTIITNEQTDEKMLCVGSGFMPAAALVDYKLTLSLPPRTTADTGVDAMTHAIEAYVSRKANPYSDTQALAALRLIAPNLLTVYRNGANEKAREAMMLGSMLAGCAFSNASVALVHGMSRPIGAFFHVPHGLSNAMLLPQVTAFSIESAPARYAQCARAMQVAKMNDNDTVSNQKLLSFLSELNVQLEVPSPKDYGIDKARYFEVAPIMAQQALDSGSPSNNPVTPSIEEMVAIYHQVWN